MRLEYLQEFASRHNTVRLAKTDKGDMVIHKIYANPQGMAKEREVLSVLSLSGYAPKVLRAEDDCLINEYIEGEILYDRYKEATALEDTDVLVNLAKHLSVFMQIFYSMFEGRILGEINFKNYIIKDNRCYGIDFEKVVDGMQYSDVAGVVANALIYVSGDSSCAFPFIKEFVKSFHLEIIDIINDVKTELERIKVNYRMIFDSDYLLNSLMYLGDKLSMTDRQRGEL